MTKTLQYAFIDTKGSPIQIGDHLVSQIDKIPLKRGIVRCHILGSLNGNHGISLKAPKGKIFLSDGRTTDVLHIWNEIGLPQLVEHTIECPTGELKIWNIYRIAHKNGIITEDKFTHNSGMIVTEVEKNRRHYACSDGIGDFDPKDFEFEIEWFTQRRRDA